MLLCGRPNSVGCITGLARLSIRLSVPYKLLTQKQKARAEETGLPIFISKGQRSGLGLELGLCNSKQRAAQYAGTMPTFY